MRNEYSSATAKLYIIVLFSKLYYVGRYTIIYILYVFYNQFPQTIVLFRRTAAVPGLHYPILLLPPSCSPLNAHTTFSSTYRAKRYVVSSFLYETYFVYYLYVWAHFSSFNYVSSVVLNNNNNNNTFVYIYVDGTYSSSSVFCIIILL